MYGVSAVAFMGQIPTMTIIVLDVLATIYYFYGIIPSSNVDPRINK
jgi:hypothetical protein